ncbi:50S ribosomal protein L11 methyltransferase [Leptolyngbya sp. FACHB-17]|uniref:50S ribosomal protein L11 methyltransferase n=1 Tax=unclassified Leptolyngbya TaxID=2650499 RepID=UPI0016800AC5|nr:50S ribosomal protein L11 methyltransferase [Leptolyngbya sp. FACHB-17]MBD2081152.1 50S ribosomal protein L11 methyltransferase [Leptolyngbya sp. FACHB-17]
MTIEFSLDANREAIDWIRSLLATVNFEGNLQIESASEPWAFHVCFYLPNDDRSKINQIETALSSLHRTGMTTELEMTVVEQESEDIVTTHRIGNKFVIVNGNYEAQSNEIALNIEESLAFGSGFHPTTTLCLRLIERHVKPDLEILDLGCGTGILSVAMAKLGAQVHAIDNDAIAVEATERAIDRNSVDVKVDRASLGKGSDLGHWMGGEAPETLSIEPAQNFDLIVANMFARILIDLSEDLKAALRLAGRLILSGFTIEYEEELTETLIPLGFERIDREQLGDWIAIVYQLH